jgi:hypothetical protein
MSACGAGVVLLALLPAVGQTFAYSEDFNDWGAMERLGSSTVATQGALARGWNVAVYPNCFTEPELVPQVMNTDGLGYALDCWGVGDCYSPQWSSARIDGLGQVDYSVPWSGTPGDLAHSGRLTPALTR